MMSKVGRNDPCPCGSGKKYKQCCIGLTASAPPVLDLATDFPPIGFDRRSMERTFADISRLLTEQEFGSAEEANSFLTQLIASPGLAPSVPSTPLEQAEDLMYDAWDARGAQRAKLARQALTISADCADAYVLLAEETAQSADEALTLYQEALSAAERALGKETLERDAGQFWGLFETRPYMRARFGLASCLWAQGQREQAIGHWTDMLRLNPNDNQGIRYILLAALLEQGDDADADALLKRYRGDAMASWAYGKALVAFRTHGDTSTARRVRTNAIGTNPYVPAYLSEKKKLPKVLPAYVGFGDESEALACADEQLEAWRRTPGAQAWLQLGTPDSGGAPASVDTIFQLKVTLKGARPPIWRRLLVRADTRLPKLHRILQTAMGWTDSHLHQFAVGPREIGVPDRDDWPPMEDERRLRLVDIAPREKSQLKYEYDFGDGWEHQILLEKVLPADAEFRSATCLAGKGACPPEDIGGVWGYADFLAAIRDPKHAQHEDLVQWIGGPFDPDAFDAEGVTAALRRIR